MNPIKMSLLAGLMALSANALAEQPPKLPLIEHQERAVESEVSAALLATPSHEARPAVKATSYPHAVESPKASMIREQIKTADQSAVDDKAARPAHEARPAVTVKHRS